MIFIFRGLISALISAIAIFLFIGFSDLNIDGIFENIGTIENDGTGNLAEDEALVSRVVDGDTVMVINSDGEEERVRLLLIDTPESVHPDEPEQKFGKESSNFAKEYLKQGQNIVLERGNPEKDNYGRTLAYIFVDGVNFNELMLEKGYARIAYVYEPNTKYLNEFKQAEKRAKEKKLNIWSIPNYVTDEGFDMSVVN